jgi:UDP-glucose 4-epimerase
MTILVTGSAGHLGEALVRLLRSQGREVRGVDLDPSPFTNGVGAVQDRDFVREAMRGVEAVVHTAALHKPHVVTHSHQQFVDTNVSGTLVLLEAAADAGVGSFVATSTTSIFGHALRPAPHEPAAWITEEVTPLPKNIYGATKLGAEHLCHIVARTRGLPVVILRTSRFFPEGDDRGEIRRGYELDNLQALELLYRRGDIEDMATAHLAALERAPEIGFGTFIISADTPFKRADLPALARDAGTVIRSYFPQAGALFAERGWSFLPVLDRVYVNRLAREVLGWRPRYDFAHVLRCLAEGSSFRSDLARAIGSKGYHDQIFDDGPYPV